MYTKVSAFIEEWKSESSYTEKLMVNLTDDSLGQKVSEGGRDLGFIAWHIAVSVSEMMNKSGLSVEGPAEDSDRPESAKEILEEYRKASVSLIDEATAKWTDEMMQDELEMYGKKWKRWLLCRILIKHEIHHRAQMTVLMRQAGLKVPGIYGPAKEEWSAYGMPEAK